MRFGRYIHTYIHNYIYIYDMGFPSNKDYLNKVVGVAGAGEMPASRRC